MKHSAFYSDRICRLMSLLKRVCVERRGVGKCVYPSSDVDGHEDPSQKHHHNQGLKHRTTGAQNTFPSLSQPSGEPLMVPQQHSRSIQILRWPALRPPPCPPRPQNGRFQCCWQRARRQSGDTATFNELTRPQTDQLK